MMPELVAVLPVVLEQEPDVAVQQVLAQVVAVQVLAVALVVADKLVPFEEPLDVLVVVAEHYPKTVQVQQLVVVRSGNRQLVVHLGKVDLGLHFEYAHLAFECR